MRRVVLSEADIHNGPLVLVRDGCPLHDSYRIQLTPLSEDGRVLMERKAASLLSQAIRAAGGDGRIVPVSGFRSKREQEELYSGCLLARGEAFTRQYVAAPGCSEHETGLALDLADGTADFDPVCPTFPDTGIFEDFRRHAAACGFIERYGKDKQALTGIAHEPWHFRYVGYPHALFMRENNLCLEEYLTLLRRYPHNGEHLYYRQTEIFFAGAEAVFPELLLPEGCVQLSGNNSDGFIITVWRQTL